MFTKYVVNESADRVGPVIPLRWSPSGMANKQILRSPAGDRKAGRVEGSIRIATDKDCNHALRSSSANYPYLACLFHSNNEIVSNASSI